MPCPLAPSLAASPENREHRETDVHPNQNFSSNGESRPFLPSLGMQGRRKSWCCVASCSPQPYDVGYLHLLSPLVLMFVFYWRRSWSRPRFSLQRRIYVKRIRIEVFRSACCMGHGAWESGGPGRSVRGRAGKVLLSQWERSWGNGPRVVIDGLRVRTYVL